MATRPLMVLPRTAMDVMRLQGGDRLLYATLLAVCRAAGVWGRPVHRSGDLATMGVMDKAYWMHKATRPLARARRGSGLEAYFEAARSVRAEVPPGLCAQASLSLSAVGDLISHPFLAASGESLYAEVRELVFGAELSMANLECVLHPDLERSLEFSPRSGPALHLDTAAFDAIKGVGADRYDFMSVASNHSLDLGPEGVTRTRETLERAGIAFHGSALTEDEARRATILERNGIRLGLLAFTFGLNGFQPPPAAPYLIHRAHLNGGAGVDLSQLEAQLAHCREREVDFVVAQLHWGMEHELYPMPEQVALAHRLAELGVDAVIGHHPHVVQPMELYRTQRDPHRLTPVFYSLGNLTTPFSAPFLTESAVARLELVKGRLPDGRVGTWVAGAAQHRVTQVADVATGTLRLIRGAPGA